MRMEPLNDEQNVAFMNDPERLEAEREKNKALELIKSAVKHDGSADYYLTVLPPYLKRLEAATENLTKIEARLYCQLQGLV